MAEPSSRSRTMATCFTFPGPVTAGTSERTIVLADRAGVVTRLPIPPGPYVYTRASRDGTRLAVGTDDGKEAAVWICRLSGEVRPTAPHDGREEPISDLVA